MNSIDEYIATFPEDVQMKMWQIVAIIKEKVPTVEESISYDMPTFKINGKRLLYFAGYKKHIGLYSVPTGDKDFVDELSKYKQGKGSVQFPLDKPIPLELIGRIIDFKLGK